MISSIARLIVMVTIASALQAGGGACYALAAELNGYPGPRHVLDLADELALSHDQRESAKAPFNKMKKGAVPLGIRLLAQEARLAKMFRSREIYETALFRVTGKIGAIDTNLRVTHLKYYLAMARLLTPHQRASYDRLRGYSSGHHPRHVH